MGLRGSARPLMWLSAAEGRLPSTDVTGKGSGVSGKGGQGFR